MMETVEFAVYKMVRLGDGSWSFKVVCFKHSPVAGGTAEIIGMATVEVENDKCCEAMGQALKQIAAQMPPTLELPKNGVG